VRPPGQLVLCGSMRALPQMEALRDLLADRGVRALSPQPDAPSSAGDHARLHEIKRAASRLHFEWIKAPATRAILVVNQHRDGQPDYIGPNAFAEIAVAFAEQRQVFLLHGVPTQYEDELLAWGARPLGGDLTPVVEFFQGRDGAAEGRVDR
jgi:hypothetical protein